MLVKQPPGFHFYCQVVHKMAPVMNELCSHLVNTQIMNKYSKVGSWLMKQINLPHPYMEPEIAMSMMIHN